MKRHRLDFTFQVLMSLLFALPSLANTVEGDYALIQGTNGCHPKMLIRVECSGLVLTNYTIESEHDPKATPNREDRFCQINQGRQNRQIDTASSLQSITTQVSSKEITEILKRELWHTIVKDEKILNYTNIDHSLILNPKAQTIVSSRVQIAATPLSQSSDTQVCTYKRTGNIKK